MADHVNDDTPSDGETGRDALMEEVRRQEERIATVHERVACPTCGSQVGERCVALNRKGRQAIKLAHRRRLIADGTYLR